MARLLRGAVAGVAADHWTLPALVEEMRRQVDKAPRKDLSRGEAMLAGQAETLDAIFHALLTRAQDNMGSYTDAAETYFRLALKAQSQCRTTWETLAEMQNPRSVAFVKQANIANGHQQINNTGAGQLETPQAKLLETTRGEWMDGGTQGQATRGDTTLETVGAIDGAAQYEG